MGEEFTCLCSLEALALFRGTRGLTVFRDLLGLYALASRALC